jgi:transposase-like protein
MARKRRAYIPEFKAEAVKLVTEQGYSVAEAGGSLGVPQTLLRSCSALGSRPSRPRGTKPSPATASSLPSRRSCAASAPRSGGCGRSATS